MPTATTLREMKRIPGEYPLEMLAQLTKQDLTCLAEIAAAQDEYSESPGIFCSWLEAMARTVIEQRETDHLEPCGWELPRVCYTNPQILADMLFDAHAIVDHCRSENGKLLATEILRDCHVFAYFYLKQLEFKTKISD